MKSLMRLRQFEWLVPDQTHLSRRPAPLSVKIPRRPRKDPTYVVGGSSGPKIFGEGEWKVRQHGVGKCRTWRKVHLAVDETTQDIICTEVSTAAWGDGEILAGLFYQVEGDIAQVSADGAYDSHGCHATIPGRDEGATIPRCDGAVTLGTTIPAPPSSRKSRPRDSTSGYHRRSIAENMMYRLKQFGDGLFSRTFECQMNEAHVRAAIINTFTYLGMPQAVRVRRIARAAWRRAAIGGSACRKGGIQYFRILVHDDSVPTYAAKTGNLLSGSAVDRLRAVSRWACFLR